MMRNQMKKGKIEIKFRMKKGKGEKYGQQLGRSANDKRPMEQTIKLKQTQDSIPLIKYNMNKE